MKAPRNFKLYTTKVMRYSLCIACRRWKHGNNIFYHEGIHWVLCKLCYFDYWENTDKLLPDYKGY